MTAAVDYSTLLAANRSRLGELPVLFIGEPERRSRYATLAMGQWPGVLAAPLFRQKLRSSPQHAFLSSQDFAGAIARQWRHLYRRRPFHALQDQVYAIDPSMYPFLIHCAGQRRPVKAAAVDVCGGPGPPRCLCDHQVDPNLRPYPGAAPGPGGWRPLETGESFLENGTSVAGGQRVAVVGGGPTAAWCVERALAAECEVLWVSDDRLNPAFVSSLRNDGLAQQPLMRHRQYRVSVVAQLVYPASPRLRFAEGYEIENIIDKGPAIEIVFRNKPRVRQRFVDASHSNLGQLRSEHVEQAVIAIGQETGHMNPCPGCGRQREQRSWATMLDAFLRPAYQALRHFLIDPDDGMPVGLQEIQSRLRVLGAAYLSHPYTQRSLRRPRDILFRYLVSLPEQAQVDRGAAMASFTTAKANGYFSHKHNRNRNFATLDQLLQIPNLDAGHARRWHALRSYRIDPLTDDEARSLMTDTRDR